MEELMTVLVEWGVAGLVIAAFAESFISPILPDVLLIPVAMANPSHAIYYGILTTLVSVVGGLVGYAIGNRLGLPVARKMMPEKYYTKINSYVKGHSQNIGWAIFLAALSPIPYKFISITAGALRVDMKIFLLASFFGRAKRFLLEAIIIYYFGDAAMAILEDFGTEMVIYSMVAVVVLVVIWWGYARYKKKSQQNSRIGY